MSTVGIFDADLLDRGTRFPNLALMKISGYHKEIGDSVILIDSYDNVPTCDKYYISKVFNYTHVPEEILDLPNITIGGTGFFEDGGCSLPHDIEHHMPDYSLYNEFVSTQIEKGLKEVRYDHYLHCSIGFTTRGCFRKCEFCVNKKYDRPFKHSPLEEFYDENRRFICLLDDNILAFRDWEEIFDELISTGKRFQFKQGLDIRLLTEKKAEKLAQCHYHGDYIFAFDHIEDKELIEKRLKIWRKHSKKSTKLYVLCAYSSQDAKDIENTFERIRILMKYGCLPYVMRYNAYLDSKYKSLYTSISRWCNQPRIFKKMSFRTFCLEHQKMRKNQDTLCATYKAMLDFEMEHPDIAKKYFDLEFGKENKYSK